MKKTKTNRFTEIGLSTFTGVVASLGVIAFAQHAEIIAPANDVLFSSNASLGLGLATTFLTTIATRIGFDIRNAKIDKENNTENTPLEKSTKINKI
jgi:chaperone required for assembly of F1-ATPase